MVPDWQYTIEIRDDTRMSKDGALRQGVVWQLVRTEVAEEGEMRSEALIASAGVFDLRTDAARDAVEKLSTLSCPIEKPIAQALREQLSGV